MRVRKVRNEHGTRVARPITCSNCGKTDVIHFTPKDASQVYCRKCAFELLGAYDPDEAELRPAQTPKLVVPELEGIEKLQRQRIKKGARVKAGVVRVKRRTED